MDTMRFLYATDLHGNKDAIEKMFEIATRDNVDAIVFGGDLTPKSVAIKLPRYPDPAHEQMDTDSHELLVGGEVLPVELLTVSRNSRTFSESLQAIKRLNDSLGPEVFVEHLQRRGAIVHEVSKPYYTFASLLEEQMILDKLGVFFRDAAHAQERPRLELSEEELSLVRDDVVDWYKKYEADWSPEARSQFAARCSAAFSENTRPFEEYAPSQYLEDCLLWKLSDQSIAETFRGIDKVLGQSKKSLITQRLAQRFRDLRERILRAQAYDRLISQVHIQSLVRYSTIEQLVDDAKAESCVRDGQYRFLQDYFFPRVVSWRKANGGRPVYAMLGNDDMVENVSLMQDADQRGALSFMHDEVLDLTDEVVIVGYGSVESLPSRVTYRRWLKEKEDILRDLRALHQLTGKKSVVWVIHNPPYGVLDQVAEGHVGSRGVLDFLNEAQPRLALFGHIHEAPRLAGTHSMKLGQTLCINPGGEHHADVHCVIVNTDSLEIVKIGG